MDLNKSELTCRDGSSCETGDSGRERDSTVDSGISMKSDNSIDCFIDFTGGRNNTWIGFDKADSLSTVSSACGSSVASSSQSQHTTEPGDVLCDVCSKTALKSCLTCMASFCGLHVKRHYTLPELQRHELVEATEDLEQRLCQIHGIKLEIYCKTDQTAICGLCVVKGHMGHDMISLQDYKKTQMNTSEMKQKTDEHNTVPPPGPIEFTSVNPDSVCLCWGPPERLTGPHSFRVSWTGEGHQEHLEVKDLKLRVQELIPGGKYKFTVATHSDDFQSLSSSVSATVQTEIPTPEHLVMYVDLTSVSVTWSKPAGVEQASYLLTLCSNGETLETISTRSLKHCFSDLAFERDYFVSVITLLEGSQSKAISETIRTSIPVPENLTVASTTSLSADLNWSLHQGMEQIPHSFLISYHSEGTELQTTTESCSLTLTDLKADTQYTVSVCCELKDGRSQATTTIFQTGICPFEKLTLDEMNEEFNNSTWCAVLSWSLEKQQIPHSFLISYQSEGTELQTIPTESCSITLTGLKADTQYTVSVSTVLQGGKENTSISTSFHTSDRRIVFLGKTGDGKSSAGNAILGEEVFNVDVSRHAITDQCKTKSKIINGRKITVTDTPGFFDAAVADEDLKSEIAKCIFDSAPGPHVFIIVLKIGRYTEHEEQILKKIKELFSDDTFKYAMILFTHGNDLNGKNIDEFVNSNSPGTVKNNPLDGIVGACHGRYHVIDNKYWNNQEVGEKSNKTQITKLFDTIEKMVSENDSGYGGYYTNELLMLVEMAIQDEMQAIMEMQQNPELLLCDRDIRMKAKKAVRWRILVNKTVLTPAMLLVGFFYLPVIPFVPVKRIINSAAAKAKNPAEALAEGLSQLKKKIMSIVRSEVRLKKMK